MRRLDRAQYMALLWKRAAEAYEKAFRSGQPISSSETNLWRIAGIAIDTARSTEVMYQERESAT